MHELFDGIFTYNYTIGFCDDSEIFPMFKAGINNLSSNEDKKEMYERFKQSYIKIWVENPDVDKDNIENEKIEAEKAFNEYWNS